MYSNGITKDSVLKELSQKKNRDSDYRKVLSSMCTYPHEIA